VDQFIGALLFLHRWEANALQHHKEIFMLQTTHPSPRLLVIATLSTFRQEWQEAAGGKSLIETEGNVGLILADLVNSFGLTTHEQSVVLGPELFEEMREVLATPSRN
jgi:hypothetical protein